MSDDFSSLFLSSDDLFDQIDFRASGYLLNSLLELNYLLFNLVNGGLFLYDSHVDSLDFSLNNLLSLFNDLESAAVDWLDLEVLELFQFLSAEFHAVDLTG